MISKQLKNILCISGLSLLMVGIGGVVTNNVSADSEDNVDDVDNVDPLQQGTQEIRSQVIQRLEARLQKLQTEYNHMSKKQRNQKITRRITRHNEHGRVIHTTVRIKRGKYIHYRMNLIHGVLGKYHAYVSQMDDPGVTKRVFRRDYRAYKKLHNEVFRAPSLVKRINLNYRRWKHASIRAQVAAYRNETLKDINYDREIRGIPPVHYSRNMNRIAAVRARQISHEYSHYYHGKLAMVQVGRKLHANWTSGIAENIDSKLAPGSNMEPTGQIYNPDSGHQMADESEDLMVYHDMFTDRMYGNFKGYTELNGHRSSILRNSELSVGIGVYYSRKSHNFFLAEEFDIGPKARHYHGKVHYHDYLKDKYFRE